MSTQQTIKDTLSNFVQSEKMSEVLSLAYITKQPCLIYGKHGYFQSEMIENVMMNLRQNEGEFFKFSLVNYKSLDDVQDLLIDLLERKKYLLVDYLQ